MAADLGLARHGRLWTEERGTNLLDTGAPFYDMYETDDGKWVVDRRRSSRSSSRELLERTGFDARRPARTRWTATAGPSCASASPQLFLTKTRDEWCELLEGTDVCFAPVLPMSEAKRAPAHRGPRDDRRARRA